MHNYMEFSINNGMKAIDQQVVQYIYLYRIKYEFKNIMIL